jgi:TonB family protein
MTKSTSFLIRQSKWTIPLLLLIVYNPNIKAQELKKVTKFSCSGIEEQYYVLKKDKSIKNGPYRLSIQNSIYQLGFYSNNKKTGIWSIYNFDHTLEFKYNYDMQMIYKLDKSYLNSPDDSTSRAPVFLGGLAYLVYRTACFTKSGEELYKRIAPGTYKVIIKFDVDSLGLPGNYIVFNSCGQKTLDDEALRCVKLATVLTFPFLPALEEGRPIKANIKLPINFTYTETKIN